MRCPCCQKDLIFTHRDHYQDISEHVSNPNGKPSLKDAYECLDQSCIANNLNCSWIDDGEIYIDPPEGISWSIAHRIIEKFSVSGMYWALDSWNHYYHIGKKKTEKRTIKIDLKIWRINIIPKEKGWKFQEYQRYNPSWYKYKIEFWKRGSREGSYILVMPITRMVIFRIKKFKINYKEWEENKNPNAFKECKNEILCLTSFGEKDDRKYAKISSFLVTFLYQRKCKKIIPEINKK